jgi:hypothetical protein
MTHDHKVWTRDGWIESKDTNYEEAKAAWPRGRSGRPEIRLSDSGLLCRVQRESGDLEDEMRLREGESNDITAPSKRQREKLRLRDEEATMGGARNPQDVEAPGLSGLEVDVRPLPAGDVPPVPQLWGARDNGMPGVEQFHELLGGYGADVPGRLGFKEGRQCCGIFESELRLGGSEDEQAIEPNYQYAEGGNADLGGIGDVRDQYADLTPAGGSRMPRGNDVRPAVSPESPWEAVFDLVNAGPNHRFTVRAPNGGDPFIVSNCDQAMCRDIMFHAAKLAEESGLELVLRVHDELLCEAPDGNDEFYRELLRKCLTTNPHWLPGFPLAAKCFASPRYVH